MHTYINEHSKTNNPQQQKRGVVKCMGHGTNWRPIFQYMTALKPRDELNLLERRQQVIIFRLRSKHIPLNAHLNRFQPQREPLCTLCPHPYETVAHILFDCPNLEDLRSILLPPSPTVENTLYCKKEQLQRTCKFFIMVSDRRAQAQMIAGSEQ